MSPEEPPLTEEELRRADLVMRSVASFVGRNRLAVFAEQLAFYDDLGYPNHRSFIHYLNKENQQKRLGDKVAMHYNLRHFTIVNQEVGRVAGDVIMHRHFEGLERLIGDDGYAAHLGGDNFELMCDGSLMDQVLSYLSGTPVCYNDHTGDFVNISSSVGVYCIPSGFVMHDQGEIMEKIITSSRAAQTGGKEQVVFFDRSLVIDREKAMRVQQLFPEALKNEEFHVFYQPKVNIATGEICGAEALCRWFLGDGIVPPMEFIPALEETKDICRLDFYMLDHVCRDIRRWLDGGQSVVRVSVNLSRKHIMDVDLVKNITSIIDKNNVPHKYIEIELTETTTDVEFSDLKRVVSALQQQGIYTSVDDFGMGYSSLNLIRAIPWNVLKVDRSLLPVEEDGRGSTRSIMFKYVVAMARALGLECVAEGVETRLQLDVLRENKCELAQGYFFDRPLPVDEFEKRLDIHCYRIRDDS